MAGEWFYWSEKERNKSGETLLSSAWKSMALPNLLTQFVEIVDLCV